MTLRRPTDSGGASLKRIGFFHFARNHDDPFGSLAEALNEKSARDESEDIRGSLIVLPEAFNLGGQYYPPGFPEVTRQPGAATTPVGRALRELQDIAACHAVVLVAGLIGEQYSSAYWIDSNNPPQLMCHKMGDDRTGNYLPHEGSDIYNPVESDIACVGALICLDALECREETDAARERRENLLHNLKECNRPYRILCIPGHMGSHCMPDPHGVFCILANSGAQKSFVKDTRRVQMVEPVDRSLNEICLVHLPPTP